MPDKIKHLVDKLIAGSINSEERKELKKMIRDYPEYEEILKTHNILDTTEFPANEPDSQAFSQMRQTVIREIRIKEMNTQTDRFNDMLDCCASGNGCGSNHSPIRIFLRSVITTRYGQSRRWFNKKE